MRHIDLKKVAKPNLNTIEIDYAISVFLTIFSHFPLKNNLVFKGGTSIKKVHYPKFRFSVDLDFTIINNEDFENNMNNLFEELFKFNIDGFRFYKLKQKPVREPNKGFSLFYNFDDEKENQPIHQPIKIDLNMTQEVILKPVWKKLVTDPYSFDLRKYSLNKTDGKIQCMRIEEIFAEKFHALFNPKRTKARDIYDIDYILSKEKNLLDNKSNLDLIKTKVELRDGSLNIKNVEEKIEILRDKWEVDLKDLVVDIPDFDEVKDRILSEMGCFQ